MTIYFTSDLHLGHANVIKLANRPFGDVDSMNEALIRNINNTVMPGDTLYILGDASCSCSREHAEQLLREIRCKHMRLLVGNHDRDWFGSDLFEEVRYYTTFRADWRYLVLMHYPILAWQGQARASIHVHGHIHSKGPDYNLDNFANGIFAFDAGVDANNYRPVALETILDLADAYLADNPIRVIKHHNHPAINSRVGACFL